MITVLALCATKYLAHAKALGDSLAQHNVHHLLNIEQSMEYRLGKRLLDPVRRALATFDFGRRRSKADQANREPLTSPSVQK